MNFQCLRYERTEYAKQIRKKYESHELSEGRYNMRIWSVRTDGICNTVSAILKDPAILIRLGTVLGVQELSPIYIQYFFDAA